MTRAIPPSLGGVVEALELDQVDLVDTDMLTQLLGEVAVATPLHVVVQRLVDRGWLLSTGVRGVYEFAPGSHAGPYRRGDPFTVLRAQMLATPDAAVRVCLGSALWLHSLADRAPEPRHEVSIATGTRAPVALGRTYRVVHHTPAVGPADGHRVPLDQPATILVHLAVAPTQVRAWREVLDVLPDLIAAADPDQIAAEAAGRGHATAARLHYLLDATADQALRDRFAVRPSGKVWFGPRRTLRRHDAARNLADTILPTHPADVRR